MLSLFITFISFFKQLSRKHIHYQYFFILRHILHKIHRIYKLGKNISFLFLCNIINIHILFLIQNQTVHLCQCLHSRVPSFFVLECTRSNHLTLPKFRHQNLLTICHLVNPNHSFGNHEHVFPVIALVDQIIALLKVSWLELFAGALKMAVRQIVERVYFSDVVLQYVFLDLASGF